MFVRTEPVHVNDSVLGVSRTPARLDFKRNTGQNNHFLITVLVGLDAVRDGNAKLGADFSTSWSPRDIKQSYARSREYALVTSLVWITDLVDVYRKRIQEMRSVLSDPESRTIMKGDGRAERLSLLASTVGVPPDNHDLLMFRFAIAWRNRIVHSDAAKRMPSLLEPSLTKVAQEIALKYRGLNVRRSIEEFKEGSAPTFKEIASFIAAGQRLVEAIDTNILERMDTDHYADTVLYSYFSNAFESNPQVFTQFWPGNARKSYRRLSTLLTQRGFTPEHPKATLDNQFLNSRSELTANEARAKYNPNVEP